MPALLVAVLGAFAIAVAFFAVANGEEQSARADTAADAAALDAVEAWHDEALALLLTGADATQASGTPAGLVGVLTAIGLFQPGSGYARASSFARANGADLRGLRWVPDRSPVTWTVEATVEQRDPVSAEKGGPERNARSTSRAQVRMLRGLCLSGTGVGITLRTGVCADSTMLLATCTRFLPNGTPNPLWKDCPSSSDLRRVFESERTLVDDPGGWL